MAPKTTKKTKTTRPSTRAVKPVQVQSAPRPGKPVVRTGTWVALIVLAAVIGAVIYLNSQSETTTEDATPTAGQTFLFTQDSLVTSIEIKPAEGDPVKVERNAEKTWVLSLPEEGEADQAAAEVAASQIGALEIVTEVDPKNDLSIFGLVKPAFVITLNFDGGKTSTLEIGDNTPSQNGYYVRVDGGKLYVISLSGIDALKNLASTPPYLNTPTPIPTVISTPLPAETPIPATDTSATPEASPTP